MSEREKHMMEALADADGLTASEYVRHFVRKDYETRFGKQKPKPKRK